MVGKTKPSKSKIIASLKPKDGLFINYPKDQSFTSSKVVFYGEEQDSCDK